MKTNIKIKTLALTIAVSGVLTQSVAMARGTRPGTFPATQKRPNMHLVLATLQPSKETVQAAKPAFGNAPLDQVEMPGGQGLERDVDGNTVIVRQGEQFIQFMAISRAGPGRDRPIPQ